MENPASNHSMDWPRKNYPKPDYLSSSRKRLAPQLLYKGSILHSWKKRMAVAVDENFFAQLPRLPETKKEKADIAWLIYQFRKTVKDDRYAVKLKEIKYTSFASTLATITTPEIGRVEDFVDYLGNRIKKNKIMGVPDPSLESPEVEPLPEQVSNDEV